MFGRRESQAHNHLTADLLSAYLDGQATAAERTQVEAHLADCPACAGELRALQATVRLLREMPPAPLPRAFTIPAAAPACHASLWDALKRGWGYRALQGATALATLLLAVLCSGDLLLQSLSTMTPMGALPAAVPATAPSEQVFFAQPTVAGLNVGETAQPAAPAGTRAAKSATETTALPPTGAPTAPPAPAGSPEAATLPKSGETQTPPPAGAGALLTATPPPPAVTSPRRDGTALPASISPAPTGASEDAVWGATPSPAATAPAYVAEARGQPTSTVGREPTFGHEIAAAPGLDLARLVVCGIEGALLVIAGGLLAVTGAAWRTRRRGR